MPTPPVAVYDANVLYLAQLRDLLMRLAVADLVRAHWSDAIHDEWIRNLLDNRDDLTRAQLERTRELMENALPGASVSGYQHREPNLTLPDPDDRHVLAAAVHAGAEWIVTFNLRDFPASVLDAYGIEAVDPDSFIAMLLHRSPEAERLTTGGN